MWLSSLASSWDESHLDQLHSVTSALETQLAAAASSDDVELQERAAELGQLLEFVRRGLDAPRPSRPVEEVTDSLGGSGGGFADRYDDDDAPQGGFAETEPPLPPSCLGLLSPLFFSHELNPVNPKAQGLVAITEGLDLDAVIVPGRWSREAVVVTEEEVDDYGRPVGRAKAGGLEVEGAGEGRKKKGGKGKGVATRKGRRREVEDDPEEMARVRFLFHGHPSFFEICRC